MKKIGFIFIATMVSSLAFASDNRGTNSHDSHHDDVITSQMHNKEHDKSINTAHIHDHQGSVTAADKHAQEFSGSIQKAHRDDHQSNDGAAAHAHDHEIK